jgi:hypothetical protein
MQMIELNKAVKSQKPNSPSEKNRVATKVTLYTNLWVSKTREQDSVYVGQMYFTKEGNPLRISARHTNILSICRSTGNPIRPFICFVSTPAPQHTSSLLEIVPVTLLHSLSIHFTLLRV